MMGFLEPVWAGVAMEINWLVNQCSARAISTPTVVEMKVNELNTFSDCFSALMYLIYCQDNIK